MLVRTITSLVNPRMLLDRLPLSVLKNHLIVGRIKTVTTGYNQRLIAPTAQYSKVAELIRIEA